jgi:hypothetical protein
VITDAKIAVLRRTRPLASLSSGFGRAVPSDAVNAPPSGPVRWTCWVAGPVSGRSTYQISQSAFEAKKQAAIDLGCEPGAIRIWGFE